MVAYMININALRDLRSLDYLRPWDAPIDFRVQGVLEYFLNLSGDKILVIGSWDGLHDCQLAQAGAVVTSSDIRPQNLQRALYRALYHRLHTITYRLLDMEEMAKEIKVDEFDIIFHSGCFYHLPNPVKHLREIAKLAEYLLLETHIADARYQSGELEGYKGCWYQEGIWEAPLAAKEQVSSFWLEESELERLFKDCHLGIVKVIARPLANPAGPRNCYLLRRNVL